MNTSFTTIKEHFKKIRKEDYFYFTIIVIFFIAVFFAFLSTVSFLSRNINKVFSTDTSTSVRTLDMDRYTLVAKKLNFVIPVFDKSGALTTPTPPSVATTTQPIDKQSLIIKVLNGTKKKGLAASLSESLVADGFIVIKTGNEEELYATTTLFLLDTKKAYEALLMETLMKTYPDAISTTTDKNSGYDAIIIIGEN
jgi:hypothetical protein